jgi:membrane-associated phospholipid phosphatase
MVTNWRRSPPADLISAMSSAVPPRSPAPAVAAPLPAPIAAPTTRRGWLIAAALAALAVAAAQALDAYAWAHWRRPTIYDGDLGRLLRLMGYLPTWLIVAAALWLTDRRSTFRGRRAALMLWAPTVGGAVAELGKMLVRRLRPDPELFVYAWRPYTEDFFSTRGLGMPSSHTMVAFAAAAALSRLMPRAWWLWLLLAAGCGATRVLALGHFASDVVAGALLGYLVGDLVSRLAPCRVDGASVT